MKRQILNPETLVEAKLNELLGEIEDAMDGDAFTFCGPITYGVEEYIRNEVEAILPKRQSKRLVVILETTGGYIEVAQRIADTIRHHYTIVEFVVPNYAMSAGTVLVMSGDAIHMDYFSILGPIDPQIEASSGQRIPALGYIEKYDELRKDPKVTAAEVAYLIAKFDPGEMYQFEQARDLSISLLKKWLVKYKFKDWDRTETRGLVVTQSMKKKRAETIARTLNKTDLWHTHGHGISMQVLRSQLKLKIEDFEATPHGSVVRDYYQLLKSYMMRRNWAGVFHRRMSYIPLSYEG